MRPLSSPNHREGPGHATSALPGFTVIAHRGACGYLPEHTLEAAALAHVMGADYIEQDVVLTRDRQLVVLHDLYLDAVSDVAQRFPGRQRGDGHFYAIDFTFEEIRALNVHERLLPGGQAEFAGRFPAADAIFRIPSLADEIRLIQGLNRSTGREVGLYVEPKSPAWHRKEESDVVSATLDCLAQFGYTRSHHRACLQSFDPAALRFARDQRDCRLKLVQLIGENSWGESTADFDHLRTAEGLAEISEYAQGIGPWLPHVVEIKENGSPDISDLVPLAHQFGLFVHAYTLRADQFPAAIDRFEAAMDLLINAIRLDGVFTDQPDRAVQFLPKTR